MMTLEQWEEAKTVAAFFGASPSSTQRDVLTYRTRQIGLDARDGPWVHTPDWTSTVPHITARDAVLWLITGNEAYLRDA